MTELSETKMAEIDAAVKALGETNFRKDPVLKWIMEANPKRKGLHTARVDIVFWLFHSPDMKQTVSVVLGKDSEEWVAYSAWTKFDDGETLVWDFSETGIPILISK